MASVCLSNSNSLIFFHLISCSPSFYNIICTVNSQWLILKTVIQNDKHKIMKRSAKQYMHWKLFHHLRQKSTVSLSLWQENHAMIPFSMACSLSHLITLKKFFFFFFSQLVQLFVQKSKQQQTNLAWPKGYVIDTLHHWVYHILYSRYLFA